jgi:hypothetical protein
VIKEFPCEIKYLAKKGKICVICVMSKKDILLTMTCDNNKGKIWQEIFA